MRAREFFALPQLNESFPFNNKKKIYSLLLNAIGTGPFDGGCVVFARALQIKFGGDIVVLVGQAQRNANEVAQHAALLLDNKLIDADGPATKEEFVRRFTKNELAHTGGTITSLRKLLPGDLPDADRNEELSKEIAKLL